MIDIKDFRPIMVVPAVPHNGGIRFLLKNEKIDIKENLADTVWKIIENANGYQNIESIANNANIDLELTTKIVQDLVTLKIMYDSRELYSHFHEISYSPDTYFRNLSRDDIFKYSNSDHKPFKNGNEEEFAKDDNSNLSKLIFNRKSCRSYSNEKLSKDLIGNICYHAYSLDKHSVPSGGGLYPLKLYILIENDQEGLSSGYYEYNSQKDTLIKFKSNIDIQQLKYCFNDEIMPFNSSIQIVIAADLERETYKYSNRGYRLTLLEAGHVAQNICLYCEENNIGTCELGGVLDEPLIKELDLENDNIYPLVTIALGKKSKEEIINYFTFKDDIESLFVGKGKPISSYDGYYFGKDSSFYGAYCIYDEENNLTAGATASSYPYAIAKAIIEGYERKQSGIVKTDFYGKANDIKGISYISPYTIKPLSKEQIKLENLNEYTNSLDISWTEGTYITTNEKVLIPSDIIYYGKNINSKNRICFSDSSGIAAFTDYDTATKKALLELIERDAIMRNWYERKAPKKISNDILPIHIKNRINYWKSQGRNVYVLDMNSKYAATVQVVITSEKYPCFVSGASSTLDDIDGSILKAMQEAEFNLLLNLRFPKKEEILPENVDTPEDHGTLYSTNKYIDNIKWLWSSNEIEKEYPKIPYDYSTLLKILNPIVVDLSEKDSYIKVVRVLSKKLLPIGFGYKADYNTHSIIKELDFNKESLKLPHYFA